MPGIFFKYVIAKRGNRILYRAAEPGVYPLLAAREGQLLCSHKVTKGLSGEMLLYAQCLCPANQSEPRAAIILPNFVPTTLGFSTNLLCPCSRTGHHCSARFRPKLFC